ncbi:MAG: putative LacI family transcriptional regulator [Lachnospiraceae bacterium]|nr:putative LacI family transcriptional regulator [Lachnospiraceae bacterium]
MADKVTIKEVAQHAGVSIATVSHVINNTRFVKEETSQKVMKSITDLRYSPDSVARTLKTGRKNIIGFIVPDIANPFFSTVIEEIEGMISKYNYQLIISNTKENINRELDNLRTLTNMVDGLILASTSNTYAEIKDYIPSSLPTVFIDRTMTDIPFDTVTISNYNCVYKGILDLIAAGHKKIGCIMPPAHLSTSIERFSAYKTALQDNNIPVNQEIIFFSEATTCSSLIYTEKLVNAGCTAIFITNNVVGDDVDYYCQQKKIQIGKDLELLRFNDSERPNYNQSEVYTVSQPVVDFGKIIAQTILDRINNNHAPIQNKVLYSTYLPKRDY